MFTVLLARAFFRDPIGRRVAVAVTVMVAGGAALTFEASTWSSWGVIGVLAVAAATLAWAADNTLTRRLAEREPLDVVAAKGGLGATFTVIVALLFGEPLPGATALAVLLACGATG